MAFESAKIARLAAPGRFLDIRINNSCRPLLRRPFGVHRVRKDVVEILNFEDVARLFKVIDQDTINILVPYDQERFNLLSEEVMDKNRGFTRSWQKRAIQYSVSVFRPKPSDVIVGCLEKIPIGYESFSEDWFLASSILQYHPKLGLIIPKSSENILIA